MKNTHLLIAGLLLSVAFVACSKKEEPVEEPTPLPPQEEVEEYSYIFALSSPGDDSQTAAAQGVKTTFDTRHVKWEVGDMVGSYSSKSSVASGNVNKSTGVTIDGSGNPHVTVRSNVALSAGNIVYAYYPYNNRNNSHESSAVTLEIPRNQVSGSASAMPMVALPFELTDDVPSYTNAEVGTLEFMNLGSVIKLNIFSSNASYRGEKIENVTFQAGAACAGSFTYDLTTANVVEPETISGYTETDVLVYGDSSNPETVGVDKDHAGVFYIIVAPGTYGGYFKIRTSRADYTYNSTSKNREYKRAGLKTLNIDLASANWTPATAYDNSIDSPREFAAFLAGTSSSDTGSYTISCDLDMTGYTITSASGFGGTLDGGDYSIKNLTSSVPLFATNSGTIQNLTIDESCAFSTSSQIFGALVNEDNGGTYSDVRNRATVTFTTTSNVSSDLMIGGLIGKAVGARLNSCTNGGAVSIQAAGYSHNAAGLGGIAGFAQGTTFDSCVNRGTVTLNADYGNPNTTLDGLSNAGIAVGGILGNGYDHGDTYTCIFNKCQNENTGVITLNHTRLNGLSTASTSAYVCVGGVLGKARGIATTCKNFAPINVTATTKDRSLISYQNYCIFVGGIAGTARWILTFESCRNDGAITVEYDGKYNGNRNRSSIGGICGWQDYESHAYGYYCSQRGNITVHAGAAAVGGIFGTSGEQIGNTVYSSCTINYTGQQGHVGGLVGIVQDNPTYYSIKNCRCEATIVAEDLNSDDKYYAVGGLIGTWGRTSSLSESWNCLKARDGNACSFTGSVSSATVSRVGIAVGYIATTSSKQNLTFGDSDNKIKASGSFGKKNLATTTIHAGNVETYAIGVNEGATVTMNIESPTAAPANLTLMSFNIREGSNWTTRRDPIVSMINGESPDIIGLQEVKDLDASDLISQGKHPWDYLKDNLSDYSGYRYGTYHNAILYKTSTVELSNTGIFFLRDDYNTSGNSWDGYERSALYATVREKATGNHFFFITTHFPMNDSNDGWNKSTALLKNRIDALNTNNYPVILMGDFNCVIGNACWDDIKTWMKNTRYSAASIVSTENRDLYTYNGFGDSSKARNKVDHIWVSKSGINVNSYVTLTNAIRSYGGYTSYGETFLSDHYPIIAHIS